MKRILGLDVGDRRIGVAISDELGISTRGLLTFERTNIRQDTQKILDTVRENNCSCVVIGLPLNLSGEDSVQTGKVRSFAQKLENKFLSNSMQNIGVILHDERYSTVIAKKALEDAGVNRKKRMAVIDQQAAAVILDDWLHTNQ